MRRYLRFFQFLLVLGAAAPAARAEILFTTNTFRFAEGGELFEEVRLSIHHPQSDDPPPETPRINAFHLELTFEPGDVGVTFTQPSHPGPTPAGGTFALPGATLVDEGSTPQRIRVSAALPNPADSVLLTEDLVFVQFQVRVPQDYPRDWFTVVFDEQSRLIGPDGDIPIELRNGVVYDAAPYVVPEPTAGLLPAAAVFLLRRRRYRRAAR